MTAKILVVEDEADVALVVRVNLERAGYEVLHARNGQDGVDLADTEQPDLILLDVMMPVMDGFTTLRELQEDPTTENIPVVMLTALSGERDIIRGHLQGAVRYLTKPFDLDVLLTTVAEALAPVDAAERSRRVETRLQLLRRLAELETGRSDPQSVRVSRLDRQPRDADRELSDGEVQRVERLTERQRLVAALLAEGVGAREIADRLGVSRSNVYATRKRIARKLAVEPDAVATEASRLGIITAVEGDGQSPG